MQISPFPGYKPGSWGCSHSVIPTFITNCLKHGVWRLPVMGSLYCQVNYNSDYSIKAFLKFHILQKVRESHWSVQIKALKIYHTLSDGVENPLQQPSGKLKVSQDYNIYRAAKQTFQVLKCKDMLLLWLKYWIHLRRLFSAVNMPPFFGLAFIKDAVNVTQR